MSRYIVTFHKKTFLKHNQLTITARDFENSPSSSYIIFKDKDNKKVAMLREFDVKSIVKVDDE